MMAWTGMNRATGKAIDESEHISQSIKDILTTPIGTRSMRREYGSEIFQLMASPQDSATRMRLMAATVWAILRWEPRVRVTSMELDGSEDGSLVVDVSFERQDGTREKTSATINLGGSS